MINGRTVADIADIEVSDLVLSFVNAVNTANRILNEDPPSSLSVTRFEVDMRLTGTIRPPAGGQSPVRFNLIPASAGRFRVDDLTLRPVEPAVLHVFQPSDRELLLPLSRTESQQIGIRAAIETVPAVQRAQGGQHAHR